MDLALVFDGPASFPRIFEARPCNDDHELSHKPTARDGACCELPKFEVPSIPDACCNLCGGLRIDEAERDGCWDGIGDTALDGMDEDVADCGGVSLDEDSLLSASNVWSTEMRRRFRGRRVPDVPAF